MSEFVLRSISTKIRLDRMILQNGKAQWTQVLDYENTNFQ